MNRGDVILILIWNWYDYGKDGLGLMIWLDGFDFLNFIYFFVYFVEYYFVFCYLVENVDIL